MPGKIKSAWDPGSQDPAYYAGLSQLSLCPWSATMSFVHCFLFTVHWILLYTPPSYLLGHTGHCTDIVQRSYICVSDTSHIIGASTLVWFGNIRNGGFSLEEPRPIVLALQWLPSPWAKFRKIFFLKLKRQQ